MTEAEGVARFRERQAAQREHQALLARTARLVPLTIQSGVCVNCGVRRHKNGFDRCHLCIDNHLGARRKRGADRAPRARPRKRESHRAAIAEGMRQRWARKRGTA